MKLLGLLWCSGSPKEKSEALYDMVCSKPYMLAGEKELSPTLCKLYRIAMEAIFDQDNNNNFSPQEIQSLEDKAFWLTEEFVDLVFENDSRTNREDWITTVSQKC